MPVSLLNTEHCKLAKFHHLYVLRPCCYVIRLSLRWVPRGWTRIRNKKTRGCNYGTLYLT